MESIWKDRLFIKVGDLTQETTEAIVNAANSSLMGGGGVDGAIHRAGGSQILDECQEIRRTAWPQGLPTGEAVLTHGGYLKAPWVIHTVGPVWKGGAQDEDALLCSAYSNSMETARTKGLKSIAFPAISTGIYGFPAKRAARLVYKTLTEYLETHALPQKVILVFFNQEQRDTFLEGVKEY